MSGAMQILREKGAGDTFFVIQACPERDIGTAAERWSPSVLAAPRPDDEGNALALQAVAADLLKEQAKRLQGMSGMETTAFKYRVVRVLPLEVMVEHSSVAAAFCDSDVGAMSTPRSFPCLLPSLENPTPKPNVTYHVIRGNVHVPTDIVRQTFPLVIAA